MFTIDTIRAAQNGDAAAYDDVRAATNDRVAGLAAKYARRMAHSGARFDDYREQFTATGHITVWRCLSTFEGETVDSFMSYVYTTAENDIRHEARDARSSGETGADREAMAVYGEMLERAEGDMGLAEKYARLRPDGGKRISADRAYAARTAWLGSLSTDYTTAGGETIAETLVSPEPIPGWDDADEERADDAATSATVRAVLATMGDSQRDVLRYTFGIEGFPYYGCGRDSNHDDRIAARMDISILNVRKTRTCGMDSFAKRWVKAVARDEAHADELRQAREETKAHTGRGARTQS